jgi:hypothetical protein
MAGGGKVTGEVTAGEPFDAGDQYPAHWVRELPMTKRQFLIKPQ